MTDERLAELERLASAATPGPWFGQSTGVYGDGFHLVGRAPDTSSADLEFIAAARTAVPELLTEVRRLRADTQALYNQLYDVCMGESAWEWCDELRANYPQYEAAREASDATP